MEKAQNPRRQFLKNTSLLALGAAVLPQALRAEEKAPDATAACDPTTLDYYGEGPFYTAGPPSIDSVGEYAVLNPLSLQTAPPDVPMNR